MLPFFRHTLIYNSVPKALDESPDGWENITRTFKRHSDYHGIFPVDSSTLRFHKLGVNDDGGYQFILDAFEDKGIKAEIQYQRERLNRKTNAYEIDYTGIIQLTPESGFKHDISERFVDAKAIDSSKLQSFLANDEKNFELESDECIDGSPTTPFSNAPFGGIYPKIDIYVYAETTGTAGLEDEGIDITTNTSGDFFYDIATVNPNYLGDKLGGLPEVVIYTNTSDSSVTVKVDVAGTFASTIIFTPTSPVPNNANIEQIIQLQAYDGGGGGLGSTLYYNSGTIQGTDITSPVTRNLTGTLGIISGVDTYIIPPDGKISMKYQYTSSGMSGISVHLTGRSTFSQLDITEIYEGAPTSQSTPSTWYPHELFQRSIQIMTGEQNTSKLGISTLLGRTDSEYQSQSFNGNRSRLGTVSGRSLRSVSGKTKINFKDWFKTVDRMGNIALWFDKLNDLFRLQSKDDVYKREQILDLGTVSKITIKPHKKSYHSQILSGTREKGEYEFIQGVNEYNVKSEHSMDVPTKDKIDMQAPYNTDSIGIERQRRETLGSDGLVDTKQDEKVFIVEFNYLNTAIVNSDIFGGSFLQGYKGIGQYYNGNYTPRKCLNNNRRHLGAGFYKGNTSDERSVLFKVNSKDLNVRLGASFEQDPIIISTSLLYFHPEIIECESNSTPDILAQLESDPHGYVKFNDEDNNIYYGYILQAGIQIYKNIAKWTFLKANI